MSIRTHTILNLSGVFVPAIAALLLFPILINSFGVEKFGAISLMWIATAASSALDFGLGRALTVLTNRANRTDQENKSLAAVGIVFSIAWAFFLFFLFFLVFLYFNLPDLSRFGSTLVWVYVAASVSLGVLGVALTGVLEARQRFVATNINKICTAVANLILPLLSFVIFGPDLDLVAALLWICKLGAVLHLVIFAFRFATFNRMRWFSSGALIWGQIRWMSLSTGTGAILVYADRAIVASICGVGQLAIYTIPQEIAQRISVITTAISTTYLPILARQKGTGSAYSSFKNQLFFIGICAVIFGVFGGPKFLSLWITTEFSTKASPILAILCIGVGLNALAMAPYTILHANMRPRPIAILHCVEVVPYLALLYFLTTNFGLIGAALAALLRNAFDLLGLNSILRKSSDDDR